MNPRSRKGIVDPVTLAAIVGIAIGTVFGSWRPLARFKKPPPTEQLSKLQADLDKAQADAKIAAEAAEAAKVAERAKMEAQIRSAQQDALGAETALKRVPPNLQTPEVKLAARMTQRVSLKLATAIGALPKDQQEAMVELIEQALSDKQAEVDEASRKLASLDSDFKAITGERAKLLAQIPKLEERAAKAEETAKAVQSQVTLTTNLVKQKANELFAASQESSSLGNAIKGLVGLLAFLFLGWVFLAFIIPALLKYMPANHFKTALRDVSGVAVGGLH
jgi:phage shock protein A